MVNQHLVAWLCALLRLKWKSIHEMANSRFEYVKSFEREDTAIPNCFIIVRIDGRGFTKSWRLHAGCTVQRCCTCPRYVLQVQSGAQVPQAERRACAAADERMRPNGGAARTYSLNIIRRLLCAASRGGCGGPRGADLGNSSPPAQILEQQADVVFAQGMSDEYRSCVRVHATRGS